MSHPNSMISSDKVNGTAVYSRNGDHIGTIDHLTIDKASGKVAYAVMGFGGFLGIGEDHHPIPWGLLQYDTKAGGYVTDITEAQLQGAPERRDDWRDDRDWEKRTHEYYQVPMYWV